ncbi:hypothetical protein C1T17_04320 [Sphingobium sp. SCG-1]|uniref:spinster family MFS transporter n=1 Tax=Sphingobium sp. SCG-1 TaxID=2072936 RepID=UPI000CD6A141|nr:MFS transporter [Sphingobium sp. SCG-1]AUW57442.1 hypothetical protein C1T17_04320 [Sphingobium sp. SCG-1]
MKDLNNQKRGSNAIMRLPQGALPWEAFSPRQRYSFLAMLFLISVVSYADRQLLPVVLGKIKLEFGLSDGMLGAIGGAPFALCYAVSTLPFARAADRGNRKAWLLVSFAFWTVATMACGFVPTLLLLFIARMGVGLGEGGAMPISHSLIANYFPPDVRGRAFAIFTAASTIGTALALIGGGWLAQHYGWRTAFLWMGALSIPIGMLAFGVLREPPRDNTYRSENNTRPRLIADLSALSTKPSFLLILSGFILYSLFGYGPITFIPTYLVRDLHVDIATAGAQYGAASAIGTLVGAVVGGVLTDKLFRRDPRWLVWLPAAGFAVSLPLAVITFSATTLVDFIVWVAILQAVLFATLPALFAAVQHVCGPSRRATATAVLLALLNAVGMTVGPLATGWLSDAFSAAAYPQSLRLALLVMSWMLAPAALLIALAGRSFMRDVE